MTDKNNEPAPSGASSLFGCGTDGAASDGDRERSADARQIMPIAMVAAGIVLMTESSIRLAFQFLAWLAKA